MTSAELFRVSASALTRHKMRAFLTLLGVIIGVATVVGVVSVLSGLNAYVTDKVIGLNPDVVIFTKYGIITSREEWLIARKRRDITLTDMAIIQRECKLCSHVGGRGDRRRPVKYADNKLADVEIQGHTPNMGEAMNFDVVTGRYFTAAEYEHAASVAVIGWDVQDQLFPHMDPIGRVMKIDGYPVKVIGTLAKQGNVMGQSQDSVVYLPLTLFKKHIAPSEDIGVFIKPIGGVAIRLRRMVRQEGAGAGPGQEIVDIPDPGIGDKGQAAREILRVFGRGRGALRQTALDERDPGVSGRQIRGQVLVARPGHRKVVGRYAARRQRLGDGLGRAVDQREKKQAGPPVAR